MFDFILGIFKYSYWTVIIIILFILGIIIRTCETANDKWQESAIENLLDDGKTDKAVMKMHEHFIEAYRADTNHVHKTDGILVEKVARKCIELDDRKSATLLYDEYRRAMSDYGRKGLEEYLNEDE